MAVDTSTAVGRVFKRLLHRLGVEAPDRATLWSYYTGDNGIPIAAAKATRDSYRRLMSMSRLNMAELVTEAVRERMQVVGFRHVDSDDALGDPIAWRIWQANGLDAESSVVHRKSLAMRDGFVMVGDVDPDLGVPTITEEDPRQIAVEMDPVRRRVVRHGLKVFIEDDQVQARLFYTDDDRRVWLISASRPARGEETGRENVEMSAWEWVGDPQPLRVMPLIAFPNQSSGDRSWGEYEKHVAVLDRINYQILSRLEIATLQAFRQRAVKGVPTRDAQGNDIDYDDIFANDPGAMWLLPGTAELWESGQVDLGPIRQATRDDVQDLAAVTRTPLFYLDPGAAQGSAEGASLSREGLIFKTKDRLISVGDSWELMMATAFVQMGEADRVDPTMFETIWTPPEQFSLNERGQAATLAQATGVPWRTIMQDIWQFSPQKVAQMEQHRAEDLLFAAQFQPAQPEPQVATSGDQG